MTTRAVEDLIEEVRFNTNVNDDARFTDDRLLLFFDSAQREIQRIIFLAHPENDIFNKEVEPVSLDGRLSYELPADIYAQSSITSVGYFPDDANTNSYTSLRKLTNKQRAAGNGYYILNKKLFLVPQSRNITPILVYTKILDRLIDTSQISELPETCEEYMMNYVERKIMYVDSNKDISIIQGFTKEEEAQIAELFAEINQDVQYPPLDDDTYVNF